jgi:hypothetical protein
MGVYNTILVECPKCHEILEFQTKSGSCCLKTFSLQDAPDHDMLDVNRHAPTDCYNDNCNAKNIHVNFDYKDGKAINRTVVCDE